MTFSTRNILETGYNVYTWVILRIVCFLLHDIYPSPKQTLALLSNHQNTSMYLFSDVRHTSDTDRSHMHEWMKKHA